MSSVDGVRRIKRLKFRGCGRKSGVVLRFGRGADNPMNRPSGKRDDPPSRPITFHAAEDLNPFDLAQLWADRIAWRIDERTQYDELAELAVMSALATWLRRWQPIAIHGAILAGARPEAVAGALGDTVEVTFDRWHEWALQQRDFIVGGKPGIMAEEYETVTRRFASVGIESAA
jgi:hypothetical protein